MTNLEKGRSGSESEKHPFGDIAKSEHPYIDAGKIFKHILTNNPTPVRLEFFRDTSDLFRAYGKPSMNPREVLARNTISHKIETDTGYAAEEKEWKVLLREIRRAGIIFERDRKSVSPP